MTGLGTLINTAAIIAGGMIGHFTGKLFDQEQQTALNKACGINLVCGKTIRVANMLPSLIIAVIAAYLPPIL